MWGEISDRLDIPSNLALSSLSQTMTTPEPVYVYRTGYLSGVLPVDRFSSNPHVEIEPSWIQKYVSGEVKRWISEMKDQGLISQDALESFDVAVSQKRAPPKYVDGVQIPGNINYSGMIYIKVESHELFYVLQGLTSEGKPFTAPLDKKSWADMSEENTSGVKSTKSYRTFVHFDPEDDEPELDVEIDLVAYRANLKECDIKKTGKIFIEDPRVMRSSILPVPRNNDYRNIIDECVQAIDDHVTVRQHNGLSYPKVELIDASWWEIDGERKAITLPPNGKKKLQITFAPDTSDACFAHHFAHEISVVGLNDDGFEDDYIIFISRMGSLWSSPGRKPDINYRNQASGYRNPPPRVQKPRVSNDGWNFA